MNHQSAIATSFRVRKDFSRLDSSVTVPPLIEMQKTSYAKFLQSGADVISKDVGLESVFRSVFPISNYNKTCTLEYEGYTLEAPKYDEEECRSRGMTFASPLKITVRLVLWDTDQVSGTRKVRDIKEQEVYLGEIPLMTQSSSFIINGIERVVVSQLHRSPGVFFSHDSGLTHPSGKLLFQARIIPYRGSWIDFEFDHKDILYVRIDRRRKMPATVLLRALGYSKEELLKAFFPVEKLVIEGDNFFSEIDPEFLLGQKCSSDIIDPTNGQALVRKNGKITKRTIKRLNELKIRRLPIDKSEVLTKFLMTDLVDNSTGEVISEANELITEDILERVKSAGITEIDLLFINGVSVGSYLRDTLAVDKITNPDEAVMEIYKRLRPGDPATLEIANTLFKSLFFSEARYDLSKVGRLKINHKFNFKDGDLDSSVLSKRDIFSVVHRLIDIRLGKEKIDDIDHLGNRRVRTVGELLENQYRVGLVRMERAIIERMSLQETESLMPHDLISAKPVSAVVKEFFGSSQLSQFMDQTNPLSELTHKRRLSALGPGGLTRDRAGFEVRDVHTSHYGRICPIETPEGPNIGLIASMSTYARINDHGFIETPYRSIVNGKRTDEIKHYNALGEEDHTIAMANCKFDKNGFLSDDLVDARKKGEPGKYPKETVDLIDVSPKQLVSVAASLIPFLEHDDANRALMGSNMQRQAVPLIRTQAPFVGTGIEHLVARDSGVTVVAKRDGIVDQVDASRIVVRTQGPDGEESGIDIYNLIKYRRSNQNTCVTQKPIVKIGAFVKKDQVIADGPATDKGELALGQNMVVAFMPWHGYNFEDSILVSENVIKNDTFTSIHIEEYECAARDTKLGKEEITNDIPNVSEEGLRNLDESGIIRIGAEVVPGDILVGKVTPKGETQLGPEEKLLRAIFGEKAGDVRDTSLRVPPSVKGTVIHVEVFAREGATDDNRLKQIQKSEEERLNRDKDAQIRILRDSGLKKVLALIGGKVTTGKLLSEDGSRELLSKGTEIDDSVLSEVPFDLIRYIPLREEDESKLNSLMDNIAEQIDMVRILFNEKIGKLKKGDELPPGVIKLVKVYIAIKRKLSVGDKMAGRHGNKGVVSRILPEEDMPYLPDGTSVQFVLNPLGVPSRMNVGQILETHLGWAGYGLGKQINNLVEAWHEKDLRQILLKIWSDEGIKKFIETCSVDDLRILAEKYRKGVFFSTAVFDGANETDIKDMLAACDLPTRGQTILFDGKTGEVFENDVTVGVLYVLKLHHLVDEKIHARSIGPYSLVTQQPLGGKAQFGGQRLGEMEVWAIEAYGAAYCLQELLTVKSDDVSGRTRIYEAIVKGENILEPGLPESFNVLIKELQALALNMELLTIDAGVQNLSQIAEVGDIN